MTKEKNVLTKKDVILLRELSKVTMFLDDFENSVLTDRIHAFKRFKCATVITEKQREVLYEAANKLFLKLT